MQNVKVRLVGLTPLLMHNPQGSMSRPGAKTAKQKVPEPEVEAENGTYRDENGYLVFPATGVRGCLINAGTGLSVRRRSMKTILKGAIFSVTSPEGDWEFLPVLNSDGERLVDYEIDVRRAVVVRAGILRARPKIRDWRIDCDINYYEEHISEKEIIDFLNRGGQIIGIGDFRPDKNGWFGRFTAELRNGA